MIFKVPKDFKGSFTLNTLSRPLWANVEISINGNDLHAPDVKAAIKNKALVPYIEGEYDDLFGISHQVKIINKADRILILGEITLRKGTSQMVSKDIAESSIVQGAENEGLVKVVSVDEKSKIEVKENKVITNKDIDDEFIIEEDDEDDEDEDEDEVGEVNKLREEIERRERKENEAKAVAWDLREQKIKEAEIISEKFEVVKIEEDEEEEKKIKKTRKKAKTKKKVKGQKKKKVKVIEPVGEVKESDNIAVGLDSRGNPLDKPSQVLENMINEISFVDEEQKQEKINKRKDEV